MAEKKLTYGEVWETLSKVDVSKHTEEKMKLTYLSWSRMWMLLCEHYPQAQYEFVDFDGVPYKTLPDGTAEVVTRIMIDDLVREMRLPVMDYKNNPVVNPHARQVSDNAMRCLVKCVAMFGLGISVFTGMADETLPDETKDEQPKGKKAPSKKAEPVKEEEEVEVEMEEEVKVEEEIEKAFNAEELVEAIAEMLIPQTEVIEELRKELSVLKERFEVVANEPATKKVTTNTFKEILADKDAKMAAKLDMLRKLRN